MTNMQCVPLFDYCGSSDLWNFAIFVAKNLSVVVYVFASFPDLYTDYVDLALLVTEISVLMYSCIWVFPAGGAGPYL